MKIAQAWSRFLFIILFCVVWELCRHRSIIQKSAVSNHPFLTVARSQLWPLPRVVMLPGPHKTGSTTVQQCMVDWAEKETLLEDWRWPTIPLTTIASLQSFSSRNKVFLPLLSILRNVLAQKKISPQDKDNILKLYQTTIESVWKEGHRIVFGSEDMAFIVSGQNNGTQMIDGILEVLPLGVVPDKTAMAMTSPSSPPPPLQRSDIEVVINLRNTPRVSHLISVWHQVGGKKTFSEWFLSHNGKKFLFMTDSLGLAVTFLDYGLRTTIIDYSGLNNDKYPRRNIHPCAVMACDILRVPCNHDHKILAFEKPEGKIEIVDKNRRTAPEEMMDLSEDQFNLIDTIMNEYDCSFKESLLQYKDNRMLRILHQNELFQSCPTNEHYKLSTEKKSLNWMHQEIKKVVEEY